MATRVIDDTKLNDIAIAIQAKDSGGQMTVDEMPTRIANIPSGGGIKEKTVNFYNYTGELVHSYTEEEIAELTELPEAPTVQGMTFQTWNWSLADIKSWVQNHDEGSLPVGAVFVTDDGHTRIYMHLREPKMASKEMPFCIQQMAGTVTIDWGDNSQPETITAAGIYSHLWQLNSYPADVMIDVEYTPSGTTKLVLGRSSANAGLFNSEPYYASCVTAMYFGANINISNSSVCRKCNRMEEVSISDGVTSIGNDAFYGCTNLALTVLPDGITSIGAYAFYGCANLTLTVLPNEVTSIGGNAFSGCTNLALTVLPDGITSIGAYAFYGCANLTLTVLPNEVTSIGGNAFRECTSLYFIDLTAFTDPQAIPTLANANAFSGIPSTAQFIVANQEMYDAFTTATNWSTYANRFQIKPRATNYITQAKDTIGGTALYNGTGYKQDYRWTPSNTEDNGSITGVPNKFAVGYIELEPGDVVHFYGEILKGTSGGLTMHIQSAADARLVRATLSNWADYTNRSDIMAYMADINYDTTTNTLHSFKWTGGTNAVKGYMHLSCVGTFTEGVTVVTINEEM